MKADQKNFVERRKVRREKIPPTYRVKARVRVPGRPETHYFEVDSLGMGGFCIFGKRDLDLELKPGDPLEVLVFRKNLSLRLTAQVLEETVESSEVKEQQNSPDSDDSEMKLRARIVGIDDRSRKILALFLEELVVSAQRKNPGDRTSAEKQ